MGFMTTLTAALALTSLTAMSINRYVRICNHDWYHVFYNKNNIVLHNLAIWIAACLWALSPLLGWGHFKYTHHMFFCSEEVDPDLLASRLVGISVFASMMVILICCYVAIFYRLSRPSEPSRSLTTHSASDPPTVKHVPPDWLYRPRLPLAGGRFMEKKLSAITEITDSDITNDLYSCSHKTTPASEPLSKEESSSSRNAVNIQVPCTQGLKTDRAVSRPSQEPIPENHASHTIESLTVTKEPSHDSVSSGCGSIESSVLGSGTSKERFYEKRLTLCIVFLTITFLVSYLPIFHFTVLNESTNMSSAFKVAFLLLTYGNNVINPILYCWGNCRLMKGYRMLYKDCLKQVCCKAKCSSQVNHG
ncbi:G-protein coupled receptor moody-like [Babylonia areolata]|uniref:G-protein coupled receptor moody-like n=1 Tax=Babylonia areolata TaxID=304850 RepID=UPI003FD04789